MIIGGITPVEREHNRLTLLRKLRAIAMAFVAILILPLVIYLLFVLGVLKSVSPFSSDIQEPVAKVTTPYAVGTAFLVSSTKLLTARHVTNGMKVGDQVTLSFEKTPNVKNVTAKIIYISPSNLATDSNGNVPIEYFLTDFAVLEVPEITDIAPLFLGESDVVAELDEVILIGYPSGDYSISKGNINSTTFKGLDLFKLDATSNPGNSGGPCLLKEDNSVIGILVGGSGPDIQGENIVVKIGNIKKTLKAANISIE